MGVEVTRACSARSYSTRPQFRNRKRVVGRGVFENFFLSGRQGPSEALESTAQGPRRPAGTAPSAAPERAAVPEQRVGVSHPPPFVGETVGGPEWPRDDRSRQVSPASSLEPTCPASPPERIFQRLVRISCHVCRCWCLPVMESPSSHFGVRCRAARASGSRLKERGASESIVSLRIFNSRWVFTTSFRLLQVCDENNRIPMLPFFFRNAVREARFCLLV